MRVMCIEYSSYMDNGSEFTIEPGQWLEVYDSSKDIGTGTGDYTYYTFEMNGKEWFIEKAKFITIQQWRHEQLKKIGV